ncbi:MAG TPA: radical SAM protein [Methanosarcina sp.]|jgi:radical SAM protein with 4Fe4S-binding SPASM domain|nr:radical SAM protein [Methanosarcina sp.]
MYCKVCETVSLRSWLLVPYAFYRRGEIFAQKLEKDEFELMQRCNGEQELEESNLLRSLILRSFLQELKGPELHPVDYRFCANRYFPRINWMITGRCNYNCLHCFNAADNERLQSEFSWEECISLLGEAEKCGVHAFTINGGEPMLHPRFMDIVRSIYERNMLIDELNTNGAFITQPILDEMKHIGCRPLMKISFDGIGHHDWLRNQKGAEQHTLNAIKLCIENDFPVMVQTNIHRKNVAAILPTLELMDTLGVMCTRVIRTSESPRWLENADDSCLAVEEYYEACLKIAGGYITNPHAMNLVFWQFLDIFPKTRTYSMRPVEGSYAAYQPDMPVCRGNRGMVAITASGELVPCNQMSGFFKNRGISFGNMKKERLQQLLLDSRYLDKVCMSVSSVLEHNEKCQNCAYWKLCLGGCRAFALQFGNDYLACDPAKCIYFHGGWMEKTEQAMKDFHNKYQE